MHPTVQEREALGRRARIEVPLAAHEDLPFGPQRRDPVQLLAEQGTTRVAELVPIRYGRMLVSPFTFFRGAARVMASDLATTPRTGITTQICGDAHLSNFGIFGSPERRLVFDINDFDETLPGPWEWDLKRLAASLAVAGRANGFTRKERRAIVSATVMRYRIAMAEFAGMGDLDVWYLHADLAGVRAILTKQLDAKRLKVVDKAVAKAHTRDSTQVLGKLTEVVDGSYRIRSAPPLIERLSDLLPDADAEELTQRFRALIRQYQQTLQSDRRVLLERYQFVDMARKVVGVGSVGTRCWIALLMGRDAGDPLFLQMKEAEHSVLAEFLSRSEYANDGHRVVAGQQLMQASSDIFLGWQRTTGIDGKQRDFYVRQLRDWKMSIEPEAMLPKGMKLYGELCSWSLARAHARSGDRIAIASYLEDGAEFDAAVAAFAEGYADVNERDHAALAEAVRTGELTAVTGL